MSDKKTKIVLDADVIIHFSKGGLLKLLPSFLSGFQFIVLDVVKREIPCLLLPILVEQISCGNINEELFGERSEEKREYSRLSASTGLGLGRGESACMVYCRYHHDVVGSSNTRDVTDYCNEYGITFLTTNDFLFYGIRQGMISKNEAYEFIKKVRDMGSFPPIVDFDTYVCSKV